MSNLTNNTTQLEALLTKVNNLPEVGGNTGSEVQYEIITIPAGATSATYTLPRVTNAYGAPELSLNTVLTQNMAFGITDGLCSYVSALSIKNNQLTCEFDTCVVYYNQGVLTFANEVSIEEDIYAVLVNDPNKDALWSCTPSE